MFALVLLTFELAYTDNGELKLVVGVVVPWDVGVMGDARGWEEEARSEWSSVRHSVRMSPGVVYVEGNGIGGGRVEDRSPAKPRGTEVRDNRRERIDMGVGLEDLRKSMEGALLEFAFAQIGGEGVVHDGRLIVEVMGDKPDAYRGM